MVRAAVRGGALAGLQWRVQMERDAAALAALVAESRAAAELAERLATAEER